MYVAAKGGEEAIAAAHDWLDEMRRGPTEGPAGASIRGGREGRGARVQILPLYATE